MARCTELWYLLSTFYEALFQLMLTKLFPILRVSTASKSSLPRYVLHLLLPLKLTMRNPQNSLHVLLLLNLEILIAQISPAGSRLMVYLRFPLSCHLLPYKANLLLTRQK